MALVQWIRPTGAFLHETETMTRRPSRIIWVVVTAFALLILSAGGAYYFANAAFHTILTQMETR